MTIDLEDHRFAPQHYFGPVPKGFLICVDVTHSGEVWRKSNYAVAQRRFNQISKEHVESLHVQCSTAGPLRYLIVLDTAPKELLNDALDVLESLERYPILDECDHSDRVYAATNELWHELSSKEKKEYGDFENFEMHMDIY